ncbi:hypothetical protein [Synechococcus sp. PCC 7336]|uniref:hypothetical protein n=1 Tax=Synechococcus sp. PCC 7336 TaxID=195250 RepID=UPI00034DDFF8|nr:hypothetical protein [Synechococcus sp. PCC 7336]
MLGHRWGIAIGLSLGVLGALASSGHAAPASAIPIPRLWLQDLANQSWQQNCRMVGLLRSQPVTSADRQWEVYSRLTYDVTPVGRRQLRSVLFARDTETGQLEAIYTPPSTFADRKGLNSDFVLLLPVEWQAESVLAREFSGLFRSNAILNRAVLWSPNGGEKAGVLEVRSPDPMPAVTVLLGWDERSADRVLFAVSDFLSLPEVVSVSASATDAIADVPAPDWLDISASVNLEAPVTNAEAQAELDSWESAWPAITGQLCAPALPS